MASDISSGCGDDIDIFEEKEEGELSLEDVSSSEESHLNYRSGFRAPWCMAVRASRKSHRKLDAAHGKENRRHTKDSGSAVPKLMVATLQEKNDDLVPISSDSDTEIVGLPGNSKQLHARSKSAKIRKKKKKKRSHGSVIRVDDPLAAGPVEAYLVDVPVAKKLRLSRAYYREPSPMHRNLRSPLARSPPRRYRASRSLKSRSPLRRSRSPGIHQSPGERRSPRKLRSPRRSLSPRSPVRSGAYRDAREHASPSSQTYVDFHDVRLLKKVRRLESVSGDPTKDRSRSKEHSSLKEKLSNMMKNEAERNATSVVNNNNNSNGGPAAADTDDEDNIEVLRRLALETKPKKSENKIEESKASSEVAKSAEESDDNDIEANELRILALRSAIMKKHEKRVTRGVKSKRPAKSQTRVESPFSESFLDDIRISGDEDSSGKTPTTRSSPIMDEESNHPEDMDLDTDIEREKEKDLMPYSPTDELTRDIVVDADFPIISDNNNDDDKLTVAHAREVATINLRPLSENSNYLAGVENKNSEIASNMLERSIEMLPQSRLLSDAPCPLVAPVMTPRAHESPSPVNDIANTESPFPLTNAPLDSEMFPIFPNLPIVQPQNEITTSNMADENSPAKTEDVAAIVLDVASPISDESVVELAIENEQSKINLQPLEEKKINVPTVPSSEISFRPIDAIDKLPEIDLDGSPLVPVSKDLEGTDLIIPIENMPDISDPANEPLYLRCLSDVVKDTNKIPTLLNRTLVPAPILKTNKQLQQPLPQKKVESHAEPSFKSAEMRPVSVEPAPVKSATLFKPIKLYPIAKKAQVMTTVAAAAFNAPSVTEPKSDDETAASEPPTTIDEPIAVPAAGNSQKIEEKPEEKKANAKSKKQRRRLREKTRIAQAAEASNSANTSLETSVESSSCNSSGKSANGANNFNEQAARASIKNWLVKSWENFQQSVLKQPSNTGAGKNNGAAVVKAGEKKKKTRRSKRKARKSSNNSSLSNKSSELDATKKVEQSDEQLTEKNERDARKSEGESSAAREESKKSEEAEKKRRCSVDEDEEALRAQLLASLPKRTKVVEATPAAPPTNPISKNSQPSDGTSDANVEISTNKAANEPTTRSLTQSALTPANPSVPTSQTSNAISATTIKLETVVVATKSAEVAAHAFVSETNNSVPETSKLTTLLKRPSSSPVKGPPKKIVKKVLPTLASTKVVNNAKKYQNALMQKKLSVQRPPMNYVAQNGSRNITLNNLKNNDAIRPSSPKISAASKTQRIVISLGSDSDSESEFEGESEPSFTNSNVQTEVRLPLPTPSMDFEKHVDQFLKNAREKAESVNQTANTTATTITAKTIETTTASNKTIGNFASPATQNLTGIYNTPLAVRRHLPISQQNEYRRLKQEIMEREKQKLQKQAIENGLALHNPSTKTPCTPPGPLSPASPIAATQKSQINNKLSSITTQATTSPLVASNRDKLPEKLVVVKKVVELANENRTNHVTNLSKPTVPAFPSKQLTTPLSASSKINSNIPNIPSKPITAKVPIKSLPKVNSINQAANISAITSTPKVQPSKATNSIYTKTSSTLVKGAVSTTKVQKFVTEASYASKTVVESSTSLSARNEARSLATMPAPSVLPATTANNAIKTSLHPAEMLTIQISNDKVQTERVASTGISKGESSSPPNGRNVGTVKVLTKEQLNSRFVKIQVKQGSAGRTVTVGGPSLTRDDAARSASSSTLPKAFPEGSSDKADKTMCCDSSLNVNESTATKNKERRLEGFGIAGPEDSTLVLSRKDEHSNDSNASTVVLAQDNSQNDTLMDSAASTFVFVHNNSECRESPRTAGTVKREDEALATNPKDPKPTNVQGKKEWEKIKSDVKTELEILTALPAEQQRIILTESQENLVAKRNMVLDDLLEMSGCLRQWEVEREIQTRLIAEVRRLREQLKVAEKRLHEQRAEMNSMGPKVTRAHEKINHGRRECFKLSRICHGLGVKVIGEDYKVPDTGAQLLNERLKEVAVHTRQLSKKKVPPIGSLNDSTVSSICSDSLSDSSFAERPSRSTTPAPEASNLDEETRNSSNAESELDDTNSSRECSEPAEKSISDFHHRNSVSERANPSIDEKSKSSEASAPLEETIETDSAKVEAQTKDKEASSALETNGQAKEKEKSRPEIVDAPSNETEASIAPERRANGSSDVPDAQPIGEKRDEDISMPSTSKYYLNRQLTLIDQQPKSKSKIVPYQSVLMHMKTPRNVNPEGILCPYELMGTCSDVDCQFYHLNPGHCQ